MNNTGTKSQAFWSAMLTVVALAWLTGGCAGQAKDNGDIKNTKAEITEPKEGDAVTLAREFTVKAKVTDLPKGAKIGAFVEVNGLLWHKTYLEEFKPGIWSGSLSEGGMPGASFRLSLLVIPEDGIRVLAAWRKKGEDAGGDFPGLKIDEITGSRRVDSLILKTK